MRLLSLDMSTKKTGWAIFNNGKLEVYNLIEASDKDISDRIIKMFVCIQELIESKKIDCVVCEDVPVSQHSNLEVGKNLCILQGCLLVLVYLHKLKFYRLKPTEWRSKIGLNRTVYTCKLCGNEFEDISALENIECKKCGNISKKEFSKKAINDRESLKRRAVEKANDEFGLDLKYIKKDNKQNGDDIAEALLIGHSFLRENDVNGK